MKKAPETDRERRLTGKGDFSTDHAGRGPAIFGSAVILEPALPLPWVRYDRGAISFVSFGKTADRKSYVCACFRDGILRFVELLRAFDTDLRPPHWPSTEEWVLFHLARRVATSAMKRPTATSVVEYVEGIRFQDGVCHRCRLATPLVRATTSTVCSQFTAYHLWYLPIANYECGVYPGTHFHLPDRCPIEIKPTLEEWRRVENHLRASATGRRLVANPKLVTGRVSPELLRLAAKRKSAMEAVRIYFENVLRDRFNAPRFGSRWQNETLLADLVQRIFPEEKVHRNHRPSWLRGLELDIYLPKRRLAIEYQGEQHYEPIEFFGGQEALIERQRRDALKAEICKARRVRLVIVSHEEALTKTHITSLIAPRR